MAQQNIGIEWHIGEEAYLQGATTGRDLIFKQGSTTESSEFGLVLQLGRLLIFCTVALGLATSVGLSPKQEAMNQAYNGVYAWLATEAEARQLDDRDGFDALLDPTIDSSWRREWALGLSAARDDENRPTRSLTALTLDSGLIRATIKVKSPANEWWRSSPYYETYFFRRTESGLVRSVPNDSYWGEERSLETANIQLEFSERDAQLAESIITPLDTLYIELRTLLELDTEDSPKAIILIDHARPRGWASVRNRQTLLSSALSKVPVSLSERDFMLQQIASRLSYIVLNEALPDTNRTYLSRWETLIWALDGHIRTELLAQRTPWHLQAEELLRDDPPAERPLSLAQVGPWDSQGASAQKSYMRQYMIAESVVAYILQEHGHTEVPRLLDGLAHHGNWSDLLLALYDLPFEEVEADWNRYLAQRFEWPPAE